MNHPFRNLGSVLLLCLPLLLGFFLGLAAGPCHAAVAAVFLFLSLLLLSFRRFPLVAAFAIAALCGALSAGRLPFLDPEEARPFLGTEVVLRGNVFQVRHTDTGWSGIVEEAVVSVPDGSASIRPQRVLLSVRNPDASVAFPAEVRATGRLHAMRSRGNPGEIPREWNALSLRVQYRFAADATRTVFIPGGYREGAIRGAFRRARGRAQRWISLQAGDSFGGMYLRAVATGERLPSSHPLVGLLRRTGLGHLLAISGLHVVFLFSAQVHIARLVLWIFRRRHGAPDLNRTSALISLPVCWAYALMVGAPISAIRAAGMLTVVVSLRHLLGIPGSGAAWSALFLSTIACAPFQVFAPSFLLSYGGSFFLIVAFAERRRNDRFLSSRFGKAAGWARDAVVASTVAFAGTLPVSAAFFEQLPAGALLWNVLFVPVLGAAGVTGALIGAMGAVFAIDLLGVPVRIAAQVAGGSLAILARLSGGGAWWYHLPPSGVAAPVFCTGAAVCSSLWLRSRGREPWPAVAAAGAAFLVWIHLPYAALPDHRLTVAALNVGKGAAHLISFPGGGHMLVDCGSGLHGDAGGHVVLPYLRQRGIRRIDVLVLTHPHEDHYGGAEAVLSSLPVGEIWIPDGVPPDSFGKAVRENIPRVHGKSRGDRYASGGAEAVVRGEETTPARREPNERSLLLEIRYGSLSVWFPGDVERGPSAWGEITPDHTGETRIVFLPHHGSPRAHPGAWIRAASPDAVVSQNSDCFRKGNLLPSLESFFLENGAVTMRSDGESVQIEQETRSRLWKFLLRLAVAG